MKDFEDQPLIFIQVNKIGFVFLVDTSCKYNLLTPCFVDFFFEEYPPSSKRIELYESLNSNFPTSEKPIHSPMYLYEGTLKRLQGIKKMKCKDGINRGCESATLAFEYKGKTYTELFYIDQSLCSFCTSRSKMFSGVLGTRFLKKHKWNIDFNKFEINN